MTLRDLLGPDGPLAAHDPHYQPRDGQIALAEAVADAAQRLHALAVEAPTGTGKTKGALLPFLVSRVPVTVCVPTKALQDQYATEAAELIGALGQTASIAVLKGRQNYLCRLDWERRNKTGWAGATAFNLPEQHLINAWQVADATADLDNAPWPLTGRQRGALGRTSDECLGRKCRLASSCGAMLARKRADEADVVILNHTLGLIAALKNGHAAPMNRPRIIDEAHDLEQAATNVLTVAITANRIRSLTRVLHRDATTDDELAAAGLLTAICDDAAEPIAAQQPVAVGGRRSLLRDERAACADAAASLAVLVPEIADLLDDDNLVITAEFTQHLETLRDQAIDLGAVLDALATEQPSVIGYAEDDTRERVVWYAVPLSVDRVLARGLWATQPTIAMSATLRAAGSFDYWRSRTGFPDAAPAIAVESAFRLRDRRGLYVVSRETADDFVPVFGDGDRAGYTARLVDTIGQLVRASGGRAFVLCPSYRLAGTIADGLALVAPACTVIAPQPGESAAGTIGRFRQATAPVLVGTQQFWQGVDIPGGQLSLIIVPQFPFSPANDPVTKARSDAVSDAGGNAFMEYALPQTALLLAQGVGRLIRRVSDSGVLALLDGRVHTKRYGGQLLRSFEPAQRLHDLDDVTYWFGGAA